MSQSLTKLSTHIVFSTKYRQPLIDAGIEAELHAYLGGVCNIMDCIPVKVGGYTDHIHILCILSRKVALMDLLEEVKKRSSKWIKEKGKAYENFYWSRLRREVWRFCCESIRIGCGDKIYSEPAPAS